MRRMCPKEFELNRKAILCYEEKCPWKLFRVRDYRKICLAWLEKKRKDKRKG